MNRRGRGAAAISSIDARGAQMIASPHPKALHLRNPARVLGVAMLAIALLLTSVPAGASGNSARYRLEGNKWLALDLSVTDVRAEMIKFHWPSTLMGIKTGYKATVRVANGSVHHVGVGIAVALYDDDSRLLGAGTTGTKLGTIDPGDSAEFTIEFKHTTQRLEQASQFHILLEIG
jgi:hypothetical protein